MTYSMRRYCPLIASHRSMGTPPPPEMVDGAEEYEVADIMGHRFFGKGRKLQYLIRWRGYSAADDTWEPQEQAFAPKIIQAYHRKHPKAEPSPHKRGTPSRSQKTIRSLLLCRTPLQTPLVNPQHRPQPLSPRSLFLLALKTKYPSRSTRTKRTWSIPPRTPPTKPKISRSPTGSRPSRPSPSSRTSTNRLLAPPHRSFADWLRPPQARSLLAPGPMSRRSKTIERSSGEPELAPNPASSTASGRRSPDSESRLLQILSTPHHPLPEDLLPMGDDSHTSPFPTWATRQPPGTSGYAPRTRLQHKARWADLRTPSTPSPSMPPPSGPQWTTIRTPKSPCPSGSESSCTPPSPTSASSYKGPGSSRTGGSPRTSLATEPPPSGSEISLPPERGSTPPSPPSERPSTSSRSGWGRPELQSDSVATRTLPTKWRRYDTKTTPQYEPMHIESDEPEVGLESNRRVMTSDVDLAPPKHSYMFCQMVSPVVGHDGGPCTCYDVGK